jgi:excisionase family DNA binding protein
MARKKVSMFAKVCAILVDIKGRGRGRRPTANGELLATINEACKALNVARSTLYELINDGTLRLVKVRGASRVPWDDIRRVAKPAE